MWSEDELDDRDWNNFTFTVFIVFCVSVAIIFCWSFIYDQNQSWQPINCVNETKTDYVFYCNNCGADSHGNVDLCIEYSQCFKHEIQVPTGRQICSQKMLVKNKTSVI